MCSFQNISNTGMYTAMEMTMSMMSWQDTLVQVKPLCQSSCQVWWHFICSMGIHQVTWHGRGDGNVNDELTRYPWSRWNHFANPPCQFWWHFIFSMGIHQVTSCTSSSERLSAACYEAVNCSLWVNIQMGLLMCIS